MSSFVGKPSAIKLQWGATATYLPNLPGVLLPGTNGDTLVTLVTLLTGDPGGIGDMIP